MHISAGLQCPFPTNADVRAYLLDNQSQWQQRFDFVLEVYTVQALPPKYEKELIQKISNFVAPGGQLLVIADVSRKERSFESGPPWLLTPEHIDSFVSCGLRVQGEVVEKNHLNDDEDIYVTTFNRVGIWDLFCRSDTASYDCYR